MAWSCHAVAAVVVDTRRAAFVETIKANDTLQTREVGRRLFVFVVLSFALGSGFVVDSLTLLAK